MDEAEGLNRSFEFSKRTTIVRGSINALSKKPRRVRLKKKVKSLFALLRRVRRKKKSLKNGSGRIRFARDSTEVSVVGEQEETSVVTSHEQEEPSVMKALGDEGTLTLSSSEGVAHVKVDANEDSIEVETSLNKQRKKILDIAPDNGEKTLSTESNALYIEKGCVKPRRHSTTAEVSSAIEFSSEESNCARQNDFSLGLMTGKCVEEEIGLDGDKNIEGGDADEHNQQSKIQDGEEGKDIISYTKEARHEYDVATDSLHNRTAREQECGEARKGSVSRTEEVRREGDVATDSSLGATERNEPRSNTGDGNIITRCTTDTQEDYKQEEDSVEVKKRSSEEERIEDLNVASLGGKLDQLVSSDANNMEMKRDDLQSQCPVATVDAGVKNVTRSTLGDMNQESRFRWIWVDGRWVKNEKLNSAKAHDS